MTSQSRELLLLDKRTWVARATLELFEKIAMAVSQFLCFALFFPLLFLCEFFPVQLDIMFDFFSVFLGPSSFFQHSL